MKLLWLIIVIVCVVLIIGGLYAIVIITKDILKEIRRRK